MSHLDPDIVTIGKAVADGLPMGAYGVTAELAEHLHTARNVAYGATLFGKTTPLPLFTRDPAAIAATFKPLNLTAD